MPKVLSGEIVSTKMKNVVVVKVERTQIHPKYRKRVKRSTRIKATTNGENKMGDVVTIEQTRPTSKQTNWKIKVKGKKE